LLLICSPNARNKSHWVPLEIEVFKETHPANNDIVAVLLGGDDPVQDNAFPAGLTRGTHQPLAVEFRPEKIDSTVTYKHYCENDGVLRVLAPLLDLEYPTLKDRQAAYERELQRKRFLIALVAAVAFAVIAFYAWNQRNRAIDELATNYWMQA